MKFLVIITLMLPAMIYAQTNSLQLSNCLSQAVAHWPGIKQSQIANEQGQIKQRNAQNSWYPQIQLAGQAIWQSDVTEVYLPIPNLQLPEMPHDQYKFYVEVNQILYDGGIAHSRKNIEEHIAISDSIQVQIDARKIKEMVIDMYFSIIYFRKVVEVADAQLVRLNKRMQNLNSAKIEGVTSGIDLLLFEVELRKAEQIRNDAKETELSLLRSLSILIGTELNENTELQLPSENETLSQTLNRPEFSLFQKQNEISGLSQKMAGKTLRPKVSAFAQSGYGRPALNMFSTEFDTYALVGVRFNWNLYDWGQSKREKELYEIKKKSINTFSENLNQTISIQISQQQSEINRIEKQLLKDNEITLIYEKILQNSATSLDQGIITATDYLDKETLHKVAQLEKTRHQVQLFKSKSMYRFIQGEL